MDVSLCTIGETKITAGNATTKAKPHAFSQINKRFSTSPTLNKVITSDMRQDINSAIKKENTKRWYFCGIIVEPLGGYQNLSLTTKYQAANGFALNRKSTLWNEINASCS